MNINGVVKTVLEPESGESAKGKWKKQTFSIMTKDQYPKEVAFTIWNDKTPLPAVDQELDVHFNAESNEYNGKFFTNLTAWKIEGGTNEDMPPPVEDEKPVNDGTGMPF
jgi:hypothetical protein